MEKNSNSDLKLQSEVSNKFDLVGVKPGKHRFPGFGEIDLTAITVSDAKALVQAGFPHLRLKSKAVAEEPATQEEKPSRK